jgi:hypothetical protein
MGLKYAFRKQKQIHHLGDPRVPLQPIPASWLDGAPPRVSADDIRKAMLARVEKSFREVELGLLDHRPCQRDAKGQVYAETYEADFTGISKEENTPAAGLASYAPELGSFAMTYGFPQDPKTVASLRRKEKEAKEGAAPPKPGSIGFDFKL